MQIKQADDVAEPCTDVLSEWPATALAALFDRDCIRFEDGCALPLMWHWLYFPAAVRGRDIGEDGHPVRTGALADAGFTRRMFAGGRTRICHPPRIGETLTRQRSIRDQTTKDGRSGPLHFVTVEYRIYAGQHLCLREEQDIVYRPAATADPAPKAPRAPAPPKAGTAIHSVSRIWHEAELVRFSALTYNGHRIHYDRDYATSVEGYANIVVHGPLIALFLLECASPHPVYASAGAFEFRARSPLYVNEPAAYGAYEAGDDTLELECRGSDDRLVMTGHIHL